MREVSSFSIMTMKKSMLYTGGVALVLVSAAAAYGTVVYQQAKAMPTLVEPSEQGVSLHQALVGLVSKWQQNEQFLGPVATGVGYHPELFEQVGGDTNSEFKGLVALKTCAPAGEPSSGADSAPTGNLTKMLSIARMSGIAQELYLHGGIGLKPSEASASEVYKDDPVLLASYFQLGQEPGLTQLLGSSPTWRWLNPTSLVEKPPASDALVKSLGECQQPSRLSAYATSLTEKLELSVHLPDGPEVVLKRVTTKAPDNTAYAAEFVYTGPRVQVEKATQLLYRSVVLEVGGDSTIAQLNRHESVSGRPEAFIHLFAEDLSAPSAPRLGIQAKAEGAMGQLSLNVFVSRRGTPQ